MGDDKKNSRLQTLLDIIFIPLVFYILTQWTEMDTLQEKAGLIILFVLVQYEYLSIRESFPKYKTSFYVLDVYSFLIFFAAVTTLSNNAKTDFEIGYDPLFWILISLLWLGYSIWNFIMFKEVTDSVEKGKWKYWGWKMAVFFVIGAACSGGIYWELRTEIPPNQTPLLIFCQTISLVLVVSTMTDWIGDLNAQFGKK